VQKTTDIGIGFKIFDTAIAELKSARSANKFTRRQRGIEIPCDLVVSLPRW
jgi:hypothetical protein